MECCMSRITEAEIADIVEKILSERTDGEATIKELVDEIPNLGRQVGRPLRET
jgi:hypothetical protein